MEMTEDREFEALVRGAMEAGLSVDAGRVRALERVALGAVRRRGRWRGFSSWGAPALMAASLAVTVVVRSMVMSLESVTSPIREVVGLLCELDGIEVEDVQTDSDGALLLSWQEIPCVDLL